MRTPSGISYVVENRRAMTHVFPELFASHRVRPVADYPARLLEVLRATAPTGIADPTVVVLTPGVHNAAYFEHSFLAGQMGVELVEGRDLVCRDNHVFMRTTAGEEPVHVVYRRVDDEYLDPLHFRADSMLGCAGLVERGARRQRRDRELRRQRRRRRQGDLPVRARDDRVLPRREAGARQRRDLRPRRSRRARVGARPHRRTRVEAGRRLGRLRPRDRSARRGGAARRRSRSRCVADPRAWIAQMPIALSTAPTYVDGTMGPRHLDLRPFALHDGEKVWVVPGGLTRVALPEGSLVVNSSQGGGSKDTWVLAGVVDDAPAVDEQTAESAVADGDGAAAAHAPAARSRSAGRPASRRPATATAAAVSVDRAVAASRSRCTGSAATPSGPRAPRASSTCTRTACSRTGAARRSRRACGCSTRSARATRPSRSAPRSRRSSRSSSTTRAIPVRSRTRSKRRGRTRAARARRSRRRCGRASTPRTRRSRRAGAARRSRGTTCSAGCATAPRSSPVSPTRA